MLPALIGAGASLLGGLFNQNSAAAAAKKNYEAQKEFAQQGVRWKVDDAKAAGIHPLYALGANTVSFSPSSAGDTSMGTAMANAGQDISRAIDATRTGGERATAFNKTVQDLQLTRLGLENELLAAQIRKVNQAGHPPSRPSAAGVGPLIPPPGPNTADGADVGGQTLPVAGTSFKTSPWATAEEIERQYGDIGQNIYGAGRAAWDVAANLYRWGSGPGPSKVRDISMARHIWEELFGTKPAF